MGRLFTYMIKAAAGEQPYTGYYGVWGHNGEGKGPRGLYALPSFWVGDSQARANAIDRLFGASRNVDSWNALAGNDKKNWGADYLTAIDTRFTSPEAIYDTLSANTDYLEAIRHLANTGSYDKLDALTSYRNRDNTNYVGDTYRRHITGGGGHQGTIYDLAGGVGNAQLVLNNYLTVDAQRKKAAEEAARKKAEEAKQQAQVPAAASVQAPTANPQQPQEGEPSQRGQLLPAEVPDWVREKPVPPPIIIQNGRIMTPHDTISPTLHFPSTMPSGEMLTDMGIQSLTQNPKPAGRTFNPALPDAPTPIVSGDELAWPVYGQLRDKVQKNIADGKSMYDGMTAATPGMTAGQRQALTTRGFVGDKQQQAAALAAAQENAAKNGMTLPKSEHDAYTGAGLRMVGHSADGRTRTYVGKSGRGRITVGDDARSGYHYRGNGNIDRNVQSNYADLRQPNTQRPVTPPSNTQRPVTPPKV